MTTFPLGKLSERLIPFMFMPSLTIRSTSACCDGENAVGCDAVMLLDPTGNESLGGGTAISSLRLQMGGAP